MAARSTQMDTDPAALLSHAAARGMRAQVRAAPPVAALFAPPTDPLDDRTRAALSERLERLVRTSADRLAEVAAARLDAAAEPALAARIRGEAEQVWDRLAAVPTLWDETLLAELLAETRLALLAAALPVRAPFNPDQPSLLARLAHSDDALIAEAAKLLLLHGSGGEYATLQQLCWPIAAALRQNATDPEEIALLDRALISAVEQLRGQDNEAPAAARLARALRRDVATLPELIEQALSDRRLELVVALVADAGGLGTRAVRDLVLERDPAPLCMLLRALDLPRETLARIGFALCEADPARDLDAFADLIDEVAAVPLQAAWRAVAAMALPAGYRTALLALGDGAGA
ncbi:MULTISPECIES: DUF2336 domain-containing protein [Sphingomonas]|uniref:DUF2336 domain-containing protein n=1 Tax=Sphingomonas TaxID=13687 RepID=UPI000F7D7629|nr:DUF2336 domain-containing protein [Sphingomonas sp. ABOLF]RSV15793.1 DUF2336 domain-containing protein [Sphingomonas sp. ABOLF]GLK21155.1 hypothetical protein GCM10017606_19810 [Microbacterium terregens]